MKQVLAELRKGRRFLLVLHVRPDGDSIGSTLALARALRRLGKEVAVVRADDIPANLAFLPGADETVTVDQVSGSFDTAVFLDCAGLDRIGAAAEAVKGCGVIVNVDHHPSNQGFGQVNYIEAGAAAVGEVTCELIRGLGVELDAEMATGLFTAITTDTGSFRYESTSPRTFRLAAELVERGARPAEISAAVWEGRPVGALRLLGLALATLRVELGGAYAWVEVEPGMIAAAGATPEDSEGLVNYPRSLRGVEVAAVLVAEPPGGVRVSLRSNRWVDVSLLASQFGGGGHARAAGCNLAGDLGAAREALLRAVAGALAS